MFKRIAGIFLCVLLCMSFASCGAHATDHATIDGGVQPAYKEVSLTEDEKFILEAIGSDVDVISDEHYMETVSELIYHPTSFSGKVYQLEGVLSLEGDQVSVYRTLADGEHTHILGLPLRYLQKEIEDGAWIRVTGIVAEMETDDGSSVAVLDVVAIEALPAYGQAVLSWDGSSVHQH